VPRRQRDYFLANLLFFKRRHLRPSLLLSGRKWDFPNTKRGQGERKRILRKTSPFLQNSPVIQFRLLLSHDGSPRKEIPQVFSAKVGKSEILIKFPKRFYILVRSARREIRNWSFHLKITMRTTDDPAFPQLGNLCLSPRRGPGPRLDM